jgi:hypothetical protein
MRPHGEPDAGIGVSVKQACAGLVLALLAAFTTVAAQTPVPKPPLSALEQLLAPVALYPDALLAQVLTSATSPGQVKDMNEWLQQNKELHGTELQDAAQKRGYDASFVALALFPEVLNLMATQIEWTTELGTAFLSDPKGVMASVQQLRAQAKAAGNLQTTPQQSVSTETQGGQQIIVIQPANPQVVYVPVYNPQVVYYPPPPGAVLLGFGLGIAIGAAMSNSAYYAPYGWGAWGMGWHTHTVVVRGGAWVVPPSARYPYVRPIPVPYGGYRPRPYVYAPTSINVNKVTVNNPRYGGGATPRPKPYAPVARPPAVPPATTLPASRSGTTAPRPTTYPAVGSTTAQTLRPATGSATRPGSPPATPVQRPASPSTAAKTNYGARGYNQAGIKPSERAQTSSNAFTGYQSGGAERAASRRGQASVSGNQARPTSSPRSK